MTVPFASLKSCTKCGAVYSDRHRRECPACHSRSNENVEDPSD